MFCLVGERESRWSWKKRQGEKTDSHTDSPAERLTTCWLIGDTHTQHTHTHTQEPNTRPAKKITHTFPQLTAQGQKTVSYLYFTRFR